MVKEEIADMINRRFAGAVNNEAEYIEIIVQAITVLVLGLVLWRLMAMFHKRKQKSRRKSATSQARFSSKWKGN